jgi:hypothetical protein
MVAADPVRNRHILLLGFLSKAIASTVALCHLEVFGGLLPWWFAVVVFLADMIYLPPFYVILRRLYRCEYVMTPE